ncbi:MAG: hypothetical protein A3F82_05215 [Deltaproteobacteria bacterium RIFCSPLOWO2_12_FULL_44_12]|nr:MAG: hypothetical protein A2712_02095 [Deltaproteobacteria bacterium RIFCSPHIGHO2_01_FULL_43_49]OGQ15084.1 MAG: hypothetical protein A3D22_03385 [Deltaproteobacteria bacterium RIFCSPHIGHO2_02_FULL_44_53]OGQ27296.1 MAG: hypothetical protein A3D98_02690 [Deltaproteobacteria bacterium RIFCSPHIGHO2_12_FULL_44_21]OGQ31601.1 MAG: hypothetical protein A2979_04545 [Deltaproteobacteria bacterium RIFCSPLOWO2_01_FULL_45_74]OGQ42801.1 MAG: hypothetical protein A3I70_06850 [Deltaproteobacteria bacterium 
MNQDGICCHLCGHERLTTIAGYEARHCITSDCRPWRKGGRLAICPTCHCVQKIIDEIWQQEVDEIYKVYQINYQNNGKEPLVFDSASGMVLPRSKRLLQCLESQLHFPKMGNLLDIGCGNGSWLHTFNQFAPQWSLTGTELNDITRSHVEKINGVKAFHTCPPFEIAGTFDLITIIEVLEHIPNPKDFLMKLSDKLESNGLLILEFPNYLEDPFDLLVADHCTHFTPSTIKEIIPEQYEIITIATHWIPKKISVVACKRKAHKKTVTPKKEPLSLDSVTQAIKWLEATFDHFSRLPVKGPLGVFGTGIAATWLACELEDKVDFFVDEDLGRINKTFMNRPVYTPSDLPENSHVLIAQPFPLAQKIHHRLAKFGATFYLPPPPQ